MSSAPTWANGETITTCRRRSAATSALASSEDVLEAGTGRAEQAGEHRLSVGEALGVLADQPEDLLVVRLFRRQLDGGPQVAFGAGLVVETGEGDGRQVAQGMGALGGRARVGARLVDLEELVPVAAAFEHRGESGERGLAAGVVRQGHVVRLHGLVFVDGGQGAAAFGPQPGQLLGVGGRRQETLDDREGAIREAEPAVVAEGADHQIVVVRAGGDGQVEAGRGLVGARQPVVPQPAEAGVQGAAPRRLVGDEQGLDVVLHRGGDASLSGQRRPGR